MKSVPTSLKLAIVLESSWYLKHHVKLVENRPVRLHFWVVFTEDFCSVETVNQHGLATLRVCCFHLAYFCISEKLPRLRAARYSARKSSEKEQ